MKLLLCAALMSVTLATPAFAAKLYLKDGGTIEAIRVWRSDGKVHVLATRHTETSFETSEVDMKRTFARHHRAAKKSKRVSRQTASAVPNEATASQKPAEKKAGMSLPSLPNLPDRNPDNLLPSSGSGGTIRQHKKEMAERAAE